MDIKATRARFLGVMLKKAFVRGPFLCQLRQAGNLFPGQALRIAGTTASPTGSPILLEPLQTHEFDTHISTYFTEPHDITRREELIDMLVSNISSAKSRVWVAVYAFTNVRLREALVLAKQKGIDVRVIMDPAQAGASNAQKASLEMGGVKVLTGDLTMHHKFCIIDHAQLFLGSFNWTSANVNNYEDYTCISGQGNAAQNAVNNYEKRFSHLWEMFILRSGTLIPPGRLSRLIEKLGFYAFCHDSNLSLGQVKVDEIFLSRLTMNEFKKLGEIHRRKGYTFQVSRYKMLMPLVEKIAPEFESLRKLVYLCLAKKRNDHFNNYLYFGAASTTKRHHKAHVNRIGGLFAHHKEVVAWVELLARVLGVPEITKAEAFAAAILHDPFPIPVPKKSPGIKADKTAEIFSSRAKQTDESSQRVFNAIRNHPHIWGNTPLTKANNMVDWILFLANYLASSRDIYFTKDLGEMDSADFLKDLLTRPFPDPYTAYAPLVENYSCLSDEEKQVLAVTYALIPAFLLSAQEIRQPDWENQMLNEKTFAIKAMLLESLEIKRSGREEKELNPPVLANLITRNNDVHVFTYDSVRKMLEGTQRIEREWILPQASAVNIRELERLAGEFLPEIEKEFRRLLNSRLGEKYQLEPIWEEVIFWMIKKAKTLDPLKLYQQFFEALKSEGQRKRFIEILGKAAYSHFETRTIRMLEQLLTGFRVPPNMIPTVPLALTSHPALGKEKSLKNISATMHNHGLRTQEINRTMEYLIKLRPQNAFRYICEVNDALLKANVNRKTVINIVEELVGHDLKEVETMGQKVDRVLEEAGIDCIKREGAMRRTDAALAQETAGIIQELANLFHETPFPDDEKDIPEFKVIASALAARNEKIRGKHGFEWKKVDDPSILERAHSLKDAIKHGAPVVFWANPDLAGVLGLAIVIDALKQETEIYFRRQNPLKANEKISDYEIRLKRYAAEHINYSFGESKWDSSQAFELARAISPRKGLDRLDLAALQILAKDGKLSLEERSKVFWGLQLLNNKTRNIGISTMLDAKDLNLRNVDEGIVGFHLLPIIEAGIQKGECDRIMKLLLADNRVDALTQLEILMKMETEIATDPTRPPRKISTAPIKIDGEIPLSLVSPGLVSLINAVFGPFNPNNEQGAMEDRPIFLIRNVKYDDWLSVGQYDSHRTMLLGTRPAFWRRANTGSRWKETGQFLFDNQGMKVDVVASVGSYRKGEYSQTNLEILDIKKGEK